MASKEWLIKDQEGHIQGPFPTKHILELIDRGYLSGDEFVALYPGDKWHRVSQEPDFYDKLLENLAGPVVEPGYDAPSKQKTHVDPETSIEKKPRGKAVRDHDPISSEEDPWHSTQGSEEPQDAVEADEESSEVIELESFDDKFRSEIARRGRWPILFLVAAVLALAYFFFEDTNTGPGRIRLVAPSGKQNLTPNQSKKLYSEALAAFQWDTFSSYLKAQNTLVRVAESSHVHAEALSLLCLTYQQLWPFSHRDEKDLKVVMAVAQKASLLDPTGLYGSTCNIVRLTVSGQYQKAAQTTDSVLNVYPTAGVLYYFKADALANQNNYRMAVAYAEKSQQLWPQWLRTYVVDGRYREKLGQWSQAAQRYRQVLNVNPNHHTSQLLLGLAEIHLNRPQQGIERIHAALSSKAMLPQLTLAEAYLALAEQADLQNRTDDALKYAKKSYALNSSRKPTRDLIVRLGGRDQLKKAKVAEDELMYLGEQYLKQGNHFAAQAEFKAAFQANPKNATGALKAAQSLWQLNQSAEAIEWLKKAIKSDPYLMDAYLTLADYHSQRYDFLAALRILSQIQRLRPKDLDVLKGYALVELRRKNFPGSIQFAQRLLKYNDTDIDTYLILARAHIGKKEYGDALNYSRRAIELDSNHAEAQAVHAKVLVGTQGVDSALYYLRKLISNYPYNLEYRLTYGEILLEDQRFESAAKIFEQLTKYDKRHKQAFLLLGECYRQLNKVDASLSAFLKAAALDPSDAEPLFEAGILYLQAEKFPQALQQFERVLNVNKMFPRTHYFIGKAAFEMGEYERALNEAKKERQLNPSLPESYVLAAQIYTKTKQYSLCAGEYQKAIEIYPEDAGVYVALSKCYRLSGSLDVASSMLDIAKSKESGRPDVYRELGALYEIKGDSDAAIAAYRQYLILLPGSKDRAEIERKISSLGG